MGVPRTWPELKDHWAYQNQLDVEAHATKTIEAMARVEARPFGGMRDEFAKIEWSVSRIAVMTGAAASRPVLQALAPFLAEAVAEAELEPPESVPRVSDNPERFAKRSAGALSLASHMNLLLCCGLAPPLGPEPDVRGRGLAVWALENGRKTLNEFDEERLAAALLALGEPDLAMAAGRWSADRAFQPNQGFHVNYGGLIANFIVGVKAGARPADVEATWVEAVANFPNKIASGTSDWSTLLWLARVVHGVIGGKAVGMVADLLQQDIARCSR